MVPETEMLDYEPEPQPSRHRGWRFVGVLFVVAGLAIISFEIAYAGKIYPGVTVDGVDVAGLSKADAQSRVNAKTTDFTGHSLAINYGKTTLRIPIKSLNISYNTAKSVDEAYNFGRIGGWKTVIHAHARSLAGRNTGYADYSYPDARLTPYLAQVNEDVVKPVANATLSVSDGHASVVPAVNGVRLDTGRLTQSIDAHIAKADMSDVNALTYEIAPTISTDRLKRSVSTADAYLAAPITVNYTDITKTIEPSVLVGWLKVIPGKTTNVMQTHDVADFFPTEPAVAIALNSESVTAYVADLAKHIDQKGQNAALTIEDGRATVFQPSRDGISLDQTTAVKDITDAASKTGNGRTVALIVNVKKPDINEGNLNDLGITELISEGVSYFPGSPPERLTNVRIGAQRFNGVLLKPGEEFSFGALLGDVGPEQGYVPGLVIVNNHEEKQYGGGLCQVSSTAFRAALNAGLPITARTNHSFAISYYTAPYGVPGVDATIYYPQVDFKFRNDTGKYILIQTTMKGTTLKFDFYGTKTKSGVIRGPQFITGTSDETKPSHTVFWRDVLDLAGKVVKTDKFDTYYKSSLDFPIVPEL